MAQEDFMKNQYGHHLIKALPILVLLLAGFSLPIGSARVGGTTSFTASPSPANTSAPVAPAATPAAGPAPPTPPNEWTPPPELAPFFDLDPDDPPLDVDPDDWADNLDYYKYVIGIPPEDLQNMTPGEIADY